MRSALDPRAKLAELYERLGRMDDYIAVTLQLLASRPEDLKARCNLARTLMRQVRFDEAERVLAEAPSKTKDWELVFLRARLAVHRADLRGAVRGYRRALALNPGALDVYFYLAEALMRLGRTGEMFAALDKAWRLCPPPAEADVRGWLDRFRLAMTRCDFAEAFRIGEYVLDRSRRLEHVETLRWPTIIEEYDLTCAPPEFHRRALARLDRLARTRPKAPWVYYYRIIIYGAMAAKEFREDTERVLRPDHERIRRADDARFGWMLMESAKRRLYAEDFPEAVKLFEAVARSTQPEGWLARCLAGEALVCQGKIPKAFAAFDAAERAAPEFEKGNVLAWRGEMRLWLGQYTEAISDLDQALTRSAQYAHCWKGGALVGAGRFGEALPILERAIAISPWDLEAKIWRAEALHHLGRHDEALEQLSDPTGDTRSPIIYWHALRGLIRRALGDAAGPREEYRYVEKWRRTVALVREGLGLASIRTDDEIAAVFESLLTRSRGLRRGGDYERRSWMP